MEPITVTDGAERFTANAYLVTGRTTALVDVGTPAWVPEVIGEHVDDLDAIYLTHTHGDHVEQLDAVVERFEVPVYAYGDHPARTDALDDGDTVPVGDTEMAVLHTPGHADDHVALVGDRTLFSGDVVVYNDGAFDDGSFGRTDGIGGSREVLIDSLERLLETIQDSVAAMYPGHGDTYSGDVRAVIERALTRAKRREPKYPEE